MSVSRTDNRHQVVIVGAGPVGLSLALGLARKGIDVLVLEKNTTTAEHSRAPAIWPGTQEVLEELGVIDIFLEEGIILPKLAVHDADRDRILFSAPLYKLAGRTAYPHLLILPQSRTETILLHALQGQTTAEVRFSCEVTDLVQSPAGVQIYFRDAGGDSVIEADYVAGCDGAHSIVREKIGASFDGITYGLHAALADFTIDDGSDLPFPRITTLPRLAVGIRMQADLWRIIMPFADDEGIPLERRADEAAQGLFGDRQRRPVWQSEFRLHQRISSTFDDGRIVLAGDAAHLNSPVGGQGMNAGIQDTALLCRVMIQALEHNESNPFAKFSTERRRQIREGVNRFTDILTKVLLSGKGRMLRTAFRFANLAMHMPPLRMRMLGQLAMLDWQRE